MDYQHSNFDKRWAVCKWPCACCWCLCCVISVDELLWLNVCCTSVDSRHTDDALVMTYNTASHVALVIKFLAILLLTFSPSGNWLTTHSQQEYSTTPYYCDLYTLPRMVSTIHSAWWMQFNPAESGLLARFTLRADKLVMFFQCLQQTLGRHLSIPQPPHGIGSRQLLHHEWVLLRLPL